MIIPTVVDSTSGNRNVFDIYSRLLNDRIILINGEIDDSTSSIVVSSLLYLDSLNHDDITIFINSPGGSVTSGLAIYDTMNYVTSDVKTIGMGSCASMGAFLLSSGKKGKRYSLKNTEIMIHEVLGSSSGQATEIKIQAEHILYLREKLNKILAHNTSKSLKKINDDTKRDYYMNADEALKYGLIDEIIK